MTAENIRTTPDPVWLTKADPGGWEVVGPFTTLAEARDWLAENPTFDGDPEWEFDHPSDDDPDGWGDDDE